MLSGVSLMSLVRIGSIGGFVTVSMGLAYQWKLNANIKSHEFYQNAIETLKTNKAALYLLGEPIKEGRVDIDDLTSHNSVNGEVGLKGSRRKGKMYFWAIRDEDNGKWIVNRIELELANENNRRLLVKSLENELNS